MPGLRREQDAEATATATSEVKQTPPHAPRLVSTIDGDPGEKTVENCALRSPCMARPTSRSKKRPPCASPTSPSKKTPPCASPLVENQLTIDGDSGEKTEANRTVPSPCDATRPPRTLSQPAPTTSTLHRVADGAPAPPQIYSPVAPRTDRRKTPVPRIPAGPVEKTVKKPVLTYPSVAPPSRPCPAQARYATAPASYAPVPFDWPIPYRAIFPRPYAPAPAAVSPSAMLPHQLPRTAAEVALARTQRQGSAGFKRKREVSPVHSAKIKEHSVRTSDEIVQNSTEPDILDSIAAFARQNPLDTDIIRLALASIPKGPESFLQCEKYSGGDQAARGATCIHTCSRGDIGHVGESSASAVKVLGFDVGPELMRFGLIKSYPWKTIWEERPLIIQDNDIVRAAKVEGVRVNVAQRITEILQNHPGPVAYFRVNSCQIDNANGAKQLEEWFELLRRKHIKEVVFMNCSWPSDMLDFSISYLDCQSVEKVSLSFMKLSDIVLEHVDNLMVINLCCCSITPMDLYTLSYLCKHLQILRIGMYEGDVIRINSKSLQVLKIWHCTVRKIAVQNASKLQRVLVAAGPNKPSMNVWIEDAPVLSAASFNLSSQYVSICDLRSKTNNAPLDNIRKLVLHVTFKVKKEQEALLNLMKSSKKLRELILWRNDEIYQYEFLDAVLDDWSVQFKDLSCLKFHLEVFMIQDCKGGEVELAISSAVLEHSSYLKQLILEGDIFQDGTVLIRAKTKLEKVDRISKAAVLTLKAGLRHRDKQIVSFLEEV